MKKIFVFGSNTQGIHGAGAALIAKQKFGAIQGVPMGLQGNSYGIITKDLNLGIRSVKLNFIMNQLYILYAFSHHRQDLTFYVTRIGCGHAGFTENEIGSQFKFLKEYMPSNIIICKELAKYVNQEEKQWIE